MVNSDSHPSAVDGKQLQRAGATPVSNAPGVAHKSDTSSDRAAGCDIVQLLEVCIAVLTMTAEEKSCTCCNQLLNPQISLWGSANTSQMLCALPKCCCDLAH